MKRLPSVTSDLRSREESIREQIEILWKYHSTQDRLDPEFVQSHALTILELSDEMLTYAREENIN